ncbi:MAG: ribosomal protein L7/L12 [Proteobacteria bacterium]|nr:ribosomal protein L7/L12 [Pseudomonadota bacterium]
MPNNYAKVRRQWKDIDIERALKALWASERFESADAVEDALRIYELAIRVEGWERVVSWARQQLADGRILNAQLVELAMRALEQADGTFLEELTRHLLDTSAPNYFRFWHTLFATRHSHRGERIFRAQLAELSDYRVIKYRRWVKRVFRTLRFRCHTPREKAIGAIAFANYRDYKPKDYPSDVFRAYLACHDAARNPKKTKSGKPVAKVKQMENFAAAAAELAIWTIAEGIRTSVGLPRTLTYLAAMAPAMTDLELFRTLRAFDANLKTADHKRASQDVVNLARYLEKRLGKMDVAIEEWCKIYPYQHSPVLVRVFEELIATAIDAARARLEPLSSVALLPIVPVSLHGRGFRVALILAYLLYRNNDDATGYLAGSDGVDILSHPSALWPYGHGARPPIWRWHPQPDHPHRVLYQMVRDTFPDAANRRESLPLDMGPYIESLRYHLYRRAVLDDRTSSADVPVLFLARKPHDDERRALLAHLDMFSAAVLVSFEQPWHEPLDAPNLIHLELPIDIAASAEILVELPKRIDDMRTSFAGRKDAIERAIRHLRLGPAPVVRHISQGPYHNAVGAQPGGAAPAAGLSDHRAGKAKRLATVVLMTAGPQKILTIKTIREITGADLKTAKDMVDNVPQEILFEVPRAEAEVAADKIAVTGAEVVVQ